MRRPSNLRRGPDGRARFLVNGRVTARLVLVPIVGAAVLGLALAASAGDPETALGWLGATLVVEVGLYLALVWGAFATFVVELDPRAGAVTARERRSGRALWTAPLTADRLFLAPHVRPFGRHRLPVTALVYGDPTTSAAAAAAAPIPAPDGTLLVEGPPAAVEAIHRELLAELPGPARSNSPDRQAPSAGSPG